METGGGRREGANGKNVASDEGEGACLRRLRLLFHLSTTSSTCMWENCREQWASRGQTLVNNDLLQNTTKANERDNEERKNNRRKREIK